MTGYIGVRKENKKFMLTFFTLAGLLYTFSIFAFILLLVQPEWADLGGLYALDLNS